MFNSYLFNAALFLGDASVDGAARLTPDPEWSTIAEDDGPDPEWSTIAED